MNSVLVCVGTRPNFVKITQFDKAFRTYNDIEYRLLHTGQHFDREMSEVFFKQFGLREPDVNLKISENTQLGSIAQILVAMEQYLTKAKPSLVMVPGDVNSSLACALAASRLGIPVAHLESGLRSFDRRMPEEINRILIDDLSDLFFVTEPSGVSNLLLEGKKESRIHFVGNTMIDSLVAFAPQIDSSRIRADLSLKDKYALCTFHRPSNVDDLEALNEIVKIVRVISEELTVLLPLHPRTKKRLSDARLDSNLASDRVILLPPLGYLDFQNLIKHAKIVITDSGGIQEETTFLKVPCLTVRENTERPITIDKGTNTLVELNPTTILEFVRSVIVGKYKAGSVPELWDGKATWRIVKIVSDFLQGR